MTYATNRLFDVPGRTSTESSKNRARQLAGRITLFDLRPSDPRACPACSGIDDGCTCSSTGAEAQALELES